MARAPSWGATTAPPPQCCMTSGGGGVLLPGGGATVHRLRRRLGAATAASSSDRTPRRHLRLLRSEEQLANGGLHPLARAGGLPHLTAVEQSRGRPRRPGARARAAGGGRSARSWRRAGHGRRRRASGQWCGATSLSSTPSFSSSSGPPSPPAGGPSHNDDGVPIRALGRRDSRPPRGVIFGGTEVVWHFGRTLQDLRRRHAGDPGRPSMGEDDLDTGLCFVGSASGKDAQASPRETARRPSLEGCGEVFAKLRIVRALSEQVPFFFKLHIYRLH
jgi:hypothetical protein